jgi:uncharacterized protein (TIGR03086 family)
MSSFSHVVGALTRISVCGEQGDGLHVRMFVDGVEDDEWPRTYDDIRSRVLAAWASDERLATPVRVPWGEVPGQDALPLYVMEVVTHTWDLSEGLGRPLRLDPEPAEYALATARAALPAGDSREGRPFGPAVPAPEGADAYGRLAARPGREPLTA